MTYFYTAEYYKRNLQEVARTIQAWFASARSARAFVNTGNAVLNHDVLERLGEISAPTILLGGAKDVITPARHAEEMGRRMRGRRYMSLREVRMDFLQNGRTLST